MARKLRVQFPGALYHVINRGNYRQALDPGLAAAEMRDIKAARWRDALDQEMTARAKTEHDVASDPKGARWKIDVAAHLRREVAAPYRWIASTLNMGSPLAVRVNVCRLANR